MVALLGSALSVAAPVQGQLPASQLGNAQAARAQAKQFMAGRGTDLSAEHSALSLSRTRSTARPRTALQPRDVGVSTLTTAWTPLGPATVNSGLYGPITGRITSIAIDASDPSGNTVWLGTTGGGVWKSTNAASSPSAVRFAPLTDTLPAFSANAGAEVPPSLSIGAVAVQPSSNPVVLAGTGDPNGATDSYYGEGILRSADGGQTWTVAFESHDGVNGMHNLAGLATAGLAWSSATPTLAVAAMAASAEAGIVGAVPSGTIPGLYFTTDAGVTWQMATVLDGTTIIQSPSIRGTIGVGATATSVVWNAQRRMFFAALQFHGYYSSVDGQNWTRLTHQPGNTLSSANCPAGAGGPGSLNCPMLRGSLAVQPATGDLYALTIDANEQDQGLWQDLCNAGADGQCASATPTFGARVGGSALEVGGGATGASTQIAQGSYNLTLLATPSSGGGTLLFAGTIDLYRCELSAGSSACAFRNTTNAGNACNAPAAVAPAQHALAAFNPAASGPTVYIGNDGGLWRSVDGVAETGSPCSSSDSSHFQNLNTALGNGGSLAEVVGFAQDAVQTGTLIAGLGADGSASSTTAGTATPWLQLSAGEGGFPEIDPVNPTNWYVSIGAGVNTRHCTSGGACAAADFGGSSDVGAVETGYDAALLDAPTLLDLQSSSQLLTATCRVWRGPAAGNTLWSSANAISPAMDGGATPCTTGSALIRSIGVGGSVGNSGPTANLGSEVIYAGMAGKQDGGATLAGHVFVTKSANTASPTTPWTDVTGSPVQNSAVGFNSSGFDLSAIVVDPHDPTGAVVYVTVMGFNKGAHVYRSADFGAHWVNISGNLPDNPANSLVVDPNDANTVYVAMDAGVFATQAVTTCTTQNCWSPLGSALPNAPVTQLQAGGALATGDGRAGMLRAATYGRGLWQTPLLTAHSLLQPQLSASPGSLSFLPQQVATQSDGLAITLQSFGNTPAVVSSIVSTSDFVETDTCTGQSIAPNANCTITVRFAPTATGNRTGLLTIYANIPGGEITVPLSGTGNTAATVVLTPLQLTFAATLVNQTTTAQIITVSNTGQTPATLQAPAITGDFAIAANTCGSSLPSQTGCSLSVVFTPTQSGTRTGVLTLQDSAGTQTAQLTGVGQSPATDTLSPAALVFAAQQVGTSSSSQQVTLTNAGDTALTLITATIAAGDFTAVNGCGPSLAAHSTCAINVAFAPAATGTRSGSLQITDQFRTQTVSLSGSAVAPPGISLSPSLVSFSPTGVGLTATSATVVLTNNGGMPLSLSSTQISGDFSIASTTCGAAVAPAAACNIVLSFTPTAAGPRTGTLTVKDNATPGTQTVSLAGTGVDFSLVANGPTSITVSDGGIATFPLQLTSVSGLSGAVALTCSGAPANTVCTINPASAQLGTTVLISATVQTGLTIQSAARPAVHRGSKGALWVATLLLPLFAFRRRRQARFASLATVLCLSVLGLAVVTSLSGCGATRLIPVTGSGGGGGGGTGSGTILSPTQPGTYPLVVTGSANGITHSVNMSLVVSAN